jgi:hypothetical protein
MSVKIDTQLSNYGDSRAYFVAPVHLPQGVTITNVTWYFYDGGSSQIWMYLGRYNHSIGGVPSYQAMAFHLSQGATGYESVSDDTISVDPIVDNVEWSYIVTVDLPPSASNTEYRFQRAVVTYEFPTGT